MAITSMDINNQSFRIASKGYDVDEVDDFLEVVASEIDALNAEVASLRRDLADARNAVPETIEVEKEVVVDSNSVVLEAKITELEGRLAERRKDDSVIAQALIVAQRAGDDIIEKAKKESSDIIASGQATASDIIAKAQNDAENIVAISRAEKNRVVEQTNLIKENANRTIQYAEDEARRILEKAQAEKQKVIDRIDQLNDSREEVLVQYQELLKGFVGTATKRLSEIGAFVPAAAQAIAEDERNEAPVEIKADPAPEFAAPVERDGDPYEAAVNFASDTVAAQNVDEYLAPEAIQAAQPAPRENVGSAQDAWAPSSAVATYTTPTINPAAPAPVAPPAPADAKDFSGYGDADDSFSFDEID